MAKNLNSSCIRLNCCCFLSTESSDLRIELLCRPSKLVNPLLSQNTAQAAENKGTMAQLKILGKRKRVSFHSLHYK